MAPELQHKVLKLLQQSPNISQREMADILGISLGKTNYFLQALVEKGWIKARNFKNNKNKLSYAYLLTPQGINEKAQLAIRFFEIKKAEYEELKKEVEALSNEFESDFESDNKINIHTEKMLASKKELKKEIVYLKELGVENGRIQS
jgi:EPS-associated MarR family transcriptional regulator